MQCQIKSEAKVFVLKLLFQEMFWSKKFVLVKKRGKILIAESDGGICGVKRERVPIAESDESFCWIKIGKSTHCCRS